MDNDSLDRLRKGLTPLRDLECSGMLGQIIPVKRLKAGAWHVPDMLHGGLTGIFRSGILTDVTFLISCIESNFSSNNRYAGEAFGTLICTGIVEVPDDATKLSQVMYSRSGGVACFHELDAPQKVITKADYLILHSNGAAFAGWKHVSPENTDVDPIGL